MKTYKIKIDGLAEADLRNLFVFLVSVMSCAAANKYIDTMMGEVESLSILADLYHPSHYADIRILSSTCLPDGIT